MIRPDVHKEHLLHMIVQPGSIRHTVQRAVQHGNSHGPRHGHVAPEREVLREPLVFRSQRPIRRVPRLSRPGLPGQGLLLQVHGAAENRHEFGHRRAAVGAECTVLIAAEQV